MSKDNSSISVQHSPTFADTENRAREIKTKNYANYMHTK